MLPQNPNISYARTGRISKAKKALNVHNCHCGRSYSRAEHLRRHSKNHDAGDALVCDVSDCGRVFYRLDLLHRHQERHLESREESASNAQLQDNVSADIPSANTSHTQTQTLCGVRSTQNFDFNSQFLHETNPFISSIGHASSIPHPGFENVYAQFSGDASGTTHSLPDASLMGSWSYPAPYPTSLAFTASNKLELSNPSVQPPSVEKSWGDTGLANLKGPTAKVSVLQPINVKPLEKGKAAYIKEEEIPPNKLTAFQTSIIKKLELVKQEYVDLSDWKVKKEEEDQENSSLSSRISDGPSRRPYNIKRRSSSDLEEISQDQAPVKYNERPIGFQQTGSQLSDIRSSLQHSTEGELQVISGDSPAGWSCDSEQWTEGSFSETESPRQSSIDSASVSKAADFVFKQFQIWNAPQGFHRRGQTGNDRSSGQTGVAYNGTNNSASEYEAVTGLQQATTTQKRIPNEDDDERRSSKRRKIEDAADDPNNRLLACPFAKNNPLVHRRCFRYVLQDIPRLKQHLMRVHRIPIHCPRCSKTFDRENERDSHLREQSQCMIGPRRTWDGINEHQRRILSKRVSAKRTTEENWYFIFGTLFPNSRRPESPYVESAQFSAELVALREFVIAEAPGHVAQFATSNLLPHLLPDQEDIESFTRAAVREVFDRVLERWERGASSQANLADQVWPTESGTSQDSTYSSQNRSLSSDQSQSISQGEEPLPPPQSDNMRPLGLQAPPLDQLIAARPQNGISNNIVIDQTALVSPSVDFEEALYDFPNFDSTPLNWENFGQ